jgi:hypothetical protein
MQNKGRQLLQIYYSSGAGKTLPQRKGRRLRKKYQFYIFFEKMKIHLQI